jgi:hypothetical protein
MNAQDFAAREPQLKIEDYFAGKTRAWGIFEDRFGNLRREFVVDINGTWDGRELVLDEDFVYSDGEQSKRVWRITKADAHRYEGRAADVVGTAVGVAYGNALNWRYDMDLKVGDSTWRVHFNDWMFLQTDDVLINRARVRKWGVDIGEVSLFFTKKPCAPDRSAGVPVAKPLRICPHT